MYCLNTVEKYPGEENPSSYAISLTEVEVLDSSHSALRIFFLTIYSDGGMPVSSLKRCLKRESERLQISESSSNEFISVR